MYPEIKKHSNSALVTLISVFFFWGFAAASNDILIPVFKESLNLKQQQVQLISVSFYVAYTVGSLIYFLISKLIKEDLLNRIGYKNGISLSLCISSTGAMLFYPAAELKSFPLMLSGLFIIGLGFSLQQIAANTLTIVCGDTSKGAQRLSLAGGVNNVGTTIGPVLVSYAIFGSIAHSASKMNSIESVKIPYLILGAALLVMAVIFRFSSLPNKIDLGTVTPSAQKDPGAMGSSQKSAFRYPQVWMGMIAIFLYVGVEVATASNLPEFMRQHIHLQTNEIAPYVSLFWASLMIGRWTASSGVFNVSNGWRQILRFLMPYLAFGVFLLVNTLANHDVTPFYVYALIIVAVIVADILSQGNPARQLMLFSSLGIVSLIVGITADGMLSVYAFISVGLFCSSLWPCIFTLAIAGLGQKTNQGSSFLVMMIFGGGIISWLQGYLANDSILGIQLSYCVGIVCFCYLVFYGWRVKYILTKRGIDYDAPVIVNEVAV
jgi:FHS family L-fucose permease-like MFS transporter